MTGPETNETTQDATLAAKQLAKLLFATARTLHRASLMGVPCQAFDELKLQVNLPRPGDWALEVSHFSSRGMLRDGEVDLTRLGRIVKITEDKALRTFFVEAVDGKLHRWPNGDFIRIFDQPFSDVGDKERLAWVAGAEKRHGFAGSHGGAVIK